MTSLTNAQKEVISAAITIYGAAHPQASTRTVAQRTTDTMMTIVSLGYWDVRSYTAKEVANLANLEPVYGVPQALYAAHRAEA